MSFPLAFTALTLALLLGAGLLLLTATFRPGRKATHLFLAILLIVLALGVWATAVRSPLLVP